MRYSLDTLSGTWLGSYASQPVALHAAYLASLAPETVVLTCEHDNLPAHIVCQVCDGRVFNPSTLRSA